jgi:hypothetical protein
VGTEERAKLEHAFGYGKSKTGRRFRQKKKGRDETGRWNMEEFYE